MPNPAFQTALAFTLRWEGGFVDHPADRGGATNQGITQATYDAWRRGRGQRVVSVRMITRPEVEAIYEAQYWRMARCHQLTHPLALAHFDAAVNHGPRRATILLQRALSIRDDGIFGPQTLAAATAGDPLAVALAAVEQREAFYRAIVRADASQGVFLVGWLNRARALREALKR